MLLGPVRTTRNCVYFANKSVNMKPFLMRTIFFTHENFRNRHQTSKMPWTSFGGRKFFAFCSLTSILHRAIIFRNELYVAYLTVPFPHNLTFMRVDYPISSLLAEVSHGKAKMRVRRETSAGLRRVV